MLTLIATLLTLATIALFLANPRWGFLLALIAKPIVDTQWEHPVLMGLKLTEIFSVAIPAIGFGHLIFKTSQPMRFRDIPFRTLWLIYLADILLFSILVFYQSSPFSGMNIFFRYINGVFAYFFIQSYFYSAEKIRQFFAALFIAGAFPIAVGMYQFLTGAQLRSQEVNDLVRNVGLYHDVITSRYLALQAIFALLLFHHFRDRPKTIYRAASYGYLLAALIVLYKTYSKSGFAILALWHLTWNLLRRQYRGLIVAGAGIFVLSGYYLSEVFTAISDLFSKELAFLDGSGEMNRTFNGRWYAWAEVYDQWDKQDFWGKFFGSGQLAMGSHNDYLQMLVHGGIFGLIIYLSLLMVIGMTLLRKLSLEKNLLTIGAIMVFEMWLVDALGLVPSAYPAYQWFIWGVIAIALRQPAHQSPSFADESEPADTLDPPKPRWVFG